MYIVNGVDNELIDEIYREILEMEKEDEDGKN
jgi:N-acetylneuraminic acid mutarotase